MLKLLSANDNYAFESTWDMDWTTILRYKLKTRLCWFYSA